MAVLRDSYVAQRTEIGLCFCNPNGVPIERMEAVNTALEIIRVASDYGYNIYMQHKNLEYEKAWGIVQDTQKEKKKPNPSMLYLMECGGHYKIGVTKDIDRRVKELDKRPFPIKVVAVSEPFEDAYIAEKGYHEQYGEYRLNGEWFDIPEKFIYGLSMEVSTAHCYEWGEECE